MQDRNTFERGHTTNTRLVVTPTLVTAPALTVAVSRTLPMVEPSRIRGHRVRPLFQQTIRVLNSLFPDTAQAVGAAGQPTIPKSTTGNAEGGRGDGFGPGGNAHSGTAGSSSGGDIDNENEGNITNGASSK